MIKTESIKNLGNNFKKILFAATLSMISSFTPTDHALTQNFTKETKNGTNSSLLLEEVKTLNKNGGFGVAVQNGLPVSLSEAKLFFNVRNFINFKGANNTYTQEIVREQEVNFNQMLISLKSIRRSDLDKNNIEKYEKIAFTLSTLESVTSNLKNLLNSQTKKKLAVQNLENQYQLLLKLKNKYATILKIINSEKIIKQEVNFHKLNWSLLLPFVGSIAAGFIALGKKSKPDNKNEESEITFDNAQKTEAESLDEAYEELGDILLLLSERLESLTINRDSDSEISDLEIDEINIIHEFMSEINEMVKSGDDQKIVEFIKEYKAASPVKTDVKLEQVL